MIDSLGNNIMEEWNNLNSSAKIIKNDSLLLDTLKRNRTLEFNAGILIPVVNKNTITPHAEAFQALIWHLIVTHPKLSPKKNKWETIK